MAERTLVNIPTELLEQVERGNVLLFIGEHLSHDPAGEAMLDHLAAELAERARLTEDSPATFAEIAQAYQDERGRQALVDFVSRRIEELGDAPQQVHQLIAGLTQCSVLVTTTLSGRLEQAFREAGRKLQVVIRNQDIAFEDEQAAQLYKLRGSLDQRDSLILTEDDNEQFFNDQDSISVVLQGYFARKTILFIGYNLEDDHFKRLYGKITASLDPYSRRSYAFGETPPPNVARWCKRKGIDVVKVDTTDFLQALTDQLAARARPTSIPIPSSELANAPLPQQPYKLLDYYEANDAAIYFGREREILELSSQIRAHRLTLLYGASGVGKTSLLLAGVVPRLAQQDQPYESIYARALEDPAQAIRRAVSRRLPEAALPQDGPLVDFLAAATSALGQPMVLMLDQFEEFFIRLSPQFRVAFTAELGAVCDARDLPIKVVLSLREDWLASVNELERRIPEVFRNRMRILPLTREQAYQAIVAPVERLGVHYEPALAERLLKDLAGSSGAEIMPPQLQLVCSALYRRLQPGEQTIVLASYERIGGARGVLQQYLADELARLNRDDRALARSVLAELVTSQGTKAVRTAGELALALDATQETLAPVLETLVGARLLRALEREDGAPSYELAHEYLIREIELDAEAKTRKQAEELIRQEVDNWQRFGTLLAADKLALINDSRVMLRLGPEAQELLLRSALEVGDEIEYWLGRMDDPAQRARVLADKARTRLPAVRMRTASVLGTQDVPESLDPLLGLALRDPDLVVRDAARASLAQLATQRTTIVEHLHIAAQSKEREERAAALRTLARLPLREVPAGLRRQVLAARLRLHSAQIVQASVASPFRRAALLTASALLVIVLLALVASTNAYYIDVRPAVIPGEPNDIVIRRGSPFLPWLGQVEVTTDLSVTRVPPHQWEVVNGRQLWGFWILRGKRDYHKWGKDLAVTVYLEDGIPMLWYLSHDEGMKALFEATKSSDNRSRGWGIEALTELMLVRHESTDSSALSALPSLLNDSDPVVRGSVAGALGQLAANPNFKSSDTIPTLLMLLKDSGYDVYSKAINALELATTNPNFRTEEVAPTLLAMLKDSDDPVYSNAAQALRQMVASPNFKPEAIIPDLLTMLRDSQPRVSSDAANTLGQMAANPNLQSEAIIPALRELLKSPKSYVRANAASLLGQIGANPNFKSEAIIPDLLALVKDSHMDVRENAARALGQMVGSPNFKPEAIIPDLLALLKDSNTPESFTATQVLGQIVGNPSFNPEEIIPDLLAFLKAAKLDNSYCGPCWNVTEVLGHAAANPRSKPDEIVPPLLTLLKSPESSVRRSAANALGQAASNPQIKVDEIITTLLTLVNDPDPAVRYSAANALGEVTTNPKSKAEDLIPTLRTLLKDPDDIVRSSAATALAKAYAQWGRTAADPVQVQIFETLIDPLNLLERPIVARSLFLRALRDPLQEKQIHDYLDTDTYSRSREPIARLWSNKVLSMLEIASLAHSVETGTVAQKQTAIQTLKQYKSAHFFGEDFTWAAQQAIDWLNHAPY